MKWFHLVVTLIGVGGVGIEELRSAPIAYEGFNYNTGTSLNDLNGGTGFSISWFQDAHTYTMTGASLADPTGTLATSGNSLHRHRIYKKGQVHIDAR